jgi:hypothetical protein
MVGTLGVCRFTKIRLTIDLLEHAVHVLQEVVVDIHHPRVVLVFFERDCGVHFTSALVLAAAALPAHLRTSL